MLPKPPLSSWWAFFPVIGLELADDADLLARPLFGDATIVSAPALLRTYARSTAPDALRAIEQRLGMFARHGAYIAVRQQARINIAWFGEQRSNHDVVRRMEQRAAQIEALLTLALLATREDGYLCGLASRFQQRTAAFGLFEATDTGTWLVSHMDEGLLDTFAEGDPSVLVSYTSSDLRNLLATPGIATLTTACTAHRSSLGDSLRASLVQAAVRLVAAIYDSSYTAQVLGAMTAIEVLLASDDERTPFKTQQQRLATLIGTPLVEHYSYAQSLHARHLYVHQGQPVLERLTPLQAISVALKALIVYGGLATHMRKRPTLLAYLDALTALGHYQHTASSIDLHINREYLDSLQSQPLPLLTYVDHVRNYEEEYAAGMYDRTDRIFADDELPNTEAT